MPPNLYRTYDTATGELQSEYAADSRSWGMVGCFLPPSEFVTLRDNAKTHFLEIIRATP
jgi:hypothetical protein